MPAQNDLCATCASVCNLPAHGEVGEPVCEAYDGGVLTLRKNGKRRHARQGLQVRPWSAGIFNDHAGYVMVNASHLIRGEYDALYCRIWEGFGEDVLQALRELSERRIIALEAAWRLNTVPAASGIDMRRTHG